MNREHKSTNENYRTGWDNIFGKKAEESKKDDKKGK